MKEVANLQLLMTVLVGCNVCAQLQTQATYIANQSAPSLLSCAGTLSGSSLQFGNGVLPCRPDRATAVGVVEAGPVFRLLFAEPDWDPVSSLAWMYAPPYLFTQVDQRLTPLTNQNSIRQTREKNAAMNNTFPGLTGCFEDGGGTGE